MKAFLLISIALALISIIYGDCDACIDNRCYSKSLIVTDEVRSLTPGIDRTTNTLYYTSTEIIDGVTTHRVKSYNLDDKSVNVITTANVISYVVDSATRNIYVTQQSIKGVYKIDLINKRLVLSGVANDEVSFIQFKNKLYYTTDSVQRISVIENGVSSVVPGTEGYEIETFIIDKNGDIYFRDASDFENMVVRRLKHGERNATQFCDWFTPTTDKDGNVYFIDGPFSSVYRVSSSGQMEEIGAVNDYVIEAAFDRDNNIVYQKADDTKYYHLKRQNNARCSTSIGGDNTRIIVRG